MMSFRTARTELTAFVMTALTAPFGNLVCPDVRSAGGGDAIPVVFVHGLLGGRANFRTLRSHLSERADRTFTSFSYGPRLDYQRLAPQLGEHIAAVQRETGAAQVDIVGHSLGGLVARYLLEMGDGGAVRRLVTLASPYYGDRFSSRELAIFANNDPFVPPPTLREGGRSRVAVVAECGHVGILMHPVALACAADYLDALADVARAEARPRPAGGVRRARSRRDGARLMQRAGLGSQRLAVAPAGLSRLILRHGAAAPGSM